jgi:hypothetical protein
VIDQSWCILRTGHRNSSRGFSTIAASFAIPAIGTRFFRLKSADGAGSPKAIGVDTPMLRIPWTVDLARVPTPGLLLRRSARKGPDLGARASGGERQFAERQEREG